MVYNVPLREVFTEMVTHINDIANKLARYNTDLLTVLAVYLIVLL